VFPVSLLLFHANRFHARTHARTHAPLAGVRRRMQLEAKRKRERERERGGRRGEGRTFSVSENMRARAISPRKARPVVQDATPRRFAVVAHARAEVVNFYRSNISRSSCNSCDENAVKPKIHKPGGKLKAISPLVTTRERISRHSSLNSSLHRVAFVSLLLLLLLADDLAKSPGDRRVFN